MWYLLEHKDSKGTMYFDELSDYLFWSGWRIKREAKASEINIFEYDVGLLTSRISQYAAGSFHLIAAFAPDVPL